MPSRQTQAEVIPALKQVLGKDDAQAAALIQDAIETHGEAAIALLNKAAHGSQKRQGALADLLIRRGDGGCPISDKSVAAIIADQSHIKRSSMIQQAGDKAERIRFAPLLREIVKDRSAPDWGFAVISLGRLKDQGAVDVLMDHTCGQETPRSVLIALVGLGSPEGALAFEPNISHPDPGTRTFALWGLAALKYETPLGGLVALLDDPDIRTPNSFRPGQSQRAAQALAAIFGWPFEWGDGVSRDAVKNRCRERFSPDFVHKCVAALAKGQLTLPDHFSNANSTPN